MSERLNFQFFCPSGKEDRAVELLQGIDCVDGLGFVASPVQKYTVDQETGEVSVTEGFGIVGQALPECLNQILTVLSAEQIAGYSRDTMVLFEPPHDPTSSSNPSQS